MLFVYFFDSFWEYEKPTPSEQQNGLRRRLRNSGSIIDYGLSSDLTDMDAVFIWERNKKTYIFKGSQYWRYNEDTRRLDRGYPRSISHGWPSLPNGIDAAVKWSNTYSYVFKGSIYWKLNNFPSNRKVYAFGGYPRYIAKGWMKCKSQSVGAFGVGALQVDP